MAELIKRSTVIDVLKETGIIVDNDLGHLVVEEIERIEAFEIVQEEAKDGGWIPCSERLPEIEGNTSDTVLVCSSDGFLYMAFWCDDLEWIFCECGMAKEPILWTNIIAWQPLPAPYQKGEPHEHK